MRTEEQLREQIRNLKVFYTNLAIYGGVSIACILIWLLTGAGPFWPIWPIFGFALAALFQGIKLGALPMLEDVLPFLKPDWEEKQIESLKGKHNEKHNAASGPSFIHRAESKMKDMESKLESKFKDVEYKAEDKVKGMENKIESKIKSKKKAGE